MSYGFCNIFHIISSSAKNLENRLRFDKVTKSLKMGTFFETQCIYQQCEWPVVSLKFKTGVLAQ